MTHNNRQTLIRALRANAIFSGGAALFLFLAGPWVAAQLGVRGAAGIYTVAGCLVLFSAQLWHIVCTRKIRRWEIWTIIGGDLVWVLASVGLVATYYRSITAAGLLLVDGVAVTVLVFAILQLRGLRRLRRAA